MRPLLGETTPTDPRAQIGDVWLREKRMPGRRPRYVAEWVSAQTGVVLYRSTTRPAAAGAVQLARRHLAGKDWREVPRP